MRVVSTRTVARRRVPPLHIPLALTVLAAVAALSGAMAQVAPSEREIAGYTGLHAAAHAADLDELERLLTAPDPDLERRDEAGRTALHVAAYASADAVVSRLAQAGSDLDALEGQAYDIVTIAAVANDVPLLELALDLGASASNITSPYDGTALIAAAHLGHVDVVRRLIAADAPLDHVNNLGWTALIEAIVLGDGGADHLAVAEALLAAGADPALADGRGAMPRELARARGFDSFIELLDEYR